MKFLNQKVNMAQLILQKEASRKKKKRKRRYQSRCGWRFQPWRSLLMLNKDNEEGGDWEEEAVTSVRTFQYKFL